MRALAVGEKYPVSDAARSAMQAHQKSRERMSKWDDSVHANHKREEEARKRREQERSELQQLIDKEDDLRQRNITNSLLLRANDLIVEDEHRNRGLRVAHMYSEVLAQRDLQTQIKQSMRLLEARETRESDAKSAKGNSQARDADNMSLQSEDIRRATHRAEIIKQLSEMIQRKQDEFRRSMEDGRLMRDALRVQREEDATREVLKRNQMLLKRSEFVATIERLKAEKNALIEKDKLVDAQVVVEEARRRELSERIRCREEQMRVEARAKRDSVIARQSELLSQLHQAEDARHAEQVAAIEAKLESEEVAKRNKRMKNLKELQECRERQIEIQRAERARELEEALDVAEFQRQLGQALEKQAANESRRIRESNVNLVAEYRRAIDEKRAATVQAIDEKLNIAKLAASVERERDDAYFKKAQSMIEKLEADGRNIVPVVKEVRRNQESA